MIYTFSKTSATQVDDPRDANIFLLMGTPESGVYLFREVDASLNPVGPFPPVNPANRVSMIDPKRFPSDKMAISVKEWRDVTEDMADPWLYYYFVRKRLFP
jgi:hypothetical protein